MAKRTVLILSSSVNELEKSGEPVKGSAWYGECDGNHVVHIAVSRFIGRIGIQAALLENPEESDWFDIYLGGVETPQLIYEAPLDKGITEVRSFSIHGNFMWLRAYMDRKNIPAAENLEQWEWARLGIVNKILLLV